MHKDNVLDVCVDRWLNANHEGKGHANGASESGIGGQDHLLEGHAVAHVLQDGPEGNVHEETDDVQERVGSKHQLHEVHPSDEVVHHDSLSEDQTSQDEDDGFGYEPDVAPHVVDGVLALCRNFGFA